MKDQKILLIVLLSVLIGSSALASKDTDNCGKSLRNKPLFSDSYESFLSSPNLQGLLNLRNDSKVYGGRITALVGKKVSGENSITHRFVRSLQSEGDNFLYFGKPISFLPGTDLNDELSSDRFTRHNLTWATNIPSVEERLTEIPRLTDIQWSTDFGIMENLVEALPKNSVIFFDLPNNIFNGPIDSARLLLPIVILAETAAKKEIIVVTTLPRSVLDKLSKERDALALLDRIRAIPLDDL
ncbi:MAG: hypothetical protein KDD40_01900 [Bdellovibrionales bacterium]|nr:hypothetical protein [Bdellovibrionales bacterium]